MCLVKGSSCIGKISTEKFIQIKKGILVAPNSCIEVQAVFRIFRKSRSHSPLSRKLVLRAIHKMRRRDVALDDVPTVQDYEIE
jgi:hypothetical protein